LGTRRLSARRITSLGYVLNVIVDLLLTLLQFNLEIGVPCAKQCICYPDVTSNRAGRKAAAHDSYGAKIRLDSNQ